MIITSSYRRFLVRENRIFVSENRFSVPGNTLFSGYAGPTHLGPPGHPGPLKGLICQVIFNNYLDCVHLRRNLHTVCAFKPDFAHMCVFKPTL